MTAEQYLQRVELGLRDLPWRARRELISDLRAHLGELPPRNDLVARLGAPETYVADLRASAGLAPRHGLVAFVRARRPRNLAIAIVLLLFAGLASATVAWVESYQPLVHGSSGLDPIGSRTDAAGATIATFHQGRPFEFGATVHNSGGFSVRIVGVPLSPRGDILPFAGRVLVSPPLGGGGINGPYIPFHPFDLNPGQERLLLFRGVYAHCRDYTGGTSIELTSIPVRFQFAWRAAVADIPLLHSLVIQVSQGRRCPG